MIIYYFLLLFIVFSRMIFTNGTVIPFETQKKNIYVIWFLALVFVSGFRGINVGTDTASYIAAFSQINSLGVRAFTEINIEPLYTLLCLLLGKITTNGQIIIIACSAITVLCLLKYIDQNSEHPTLSVVLYICLYFFFMSMNGMRQFVGIGFTLLSNQYAKKREIVPFILMILIAFGFHTSCLLGASLWFLYNNNREGKGTLRMPIIIAVLGIVVFVFVNQIFAGISNFYVNASFYLNNAGVEERSGIMLPILCCMVFVAGMLAYLDPEWREDPDNRFLFYAAEISMIWSIGSALFVNLNYNIIQRIGWLFQIYSIVLLPNVIECKIFKNSRVIMYSIILFAGLAFLYYYLRINWHHVVPYSFCF